MQNLNVFVKIQKAFAIAGACNARRFKQIIVTTTKDKLHLGDSEHAEKQNKVKAKKIFCRMFVCL